jgi:hypothetical protein
MSTGSSPDDHRTIEGMPLRSVEWVKLRWSVYREYLDHFHDGDKASDHMRERLFEAVSPGLASLVESSSIRRRRIWWSCESPETEELPWELMVLRPGVETSFVRGLPGPPRALIPRRGPLKIMVVARSEDDIDRLGLRTPMADVHLIGVSGAKPARTAIDEAVRAGAELLHVVADGTVLPSWDSLLKIGDETLASSELSSRVRGSRITLIALSPSVAAIASEPDRVPTVYRAFSHIGRAVDATNVVAQLGPWDHARIPLFPAVYIATAKTNSIEAGVREARQHTSSLAPLTLFLLQRLGRELSARTRTSADVVAGNPQQAEAHADVARRVVGQLRAVDQRYPSLAAPLSGTTEFREQEASIEKLDADLAPWTQLEDDER